ncbi:PilZ domain-containing protein [Allosphingosinicella indica]|uniref:PilZ domain-containing protein n=1 Tax=Allosphingosinicella indica TaxID=941907 RepID=A0A1X7GS28_9SPHN|nr:PilZ domain-containing protein [Allosphingosinicella indica]SMF73699.1 PilZ domain-containing protein [Allosphingosinicella indica]
MFDFNPSSSAKRPLEGRRAYRDSLFLCATIRRGSDPAGDLAPVRVRNLSSVGLMADYDDKVECGDPVVATLKGLGSVKGRVVWVQGGQIGIAFDDEVDPIKARRSVGRRAAGGAAPPRTR